MTDVSTLPLVEQENCAVCQQPVSDPAEWVSVIRGMMRCIGKDKEKKDLYYKEPTTKITAPVCAGCQAEGVRKIKSRRVINCILSILFWPIGIALLLGAFYLMVSDDVDFGIQVGNFIVVPWILIIIVCIPGILFIALAVHTGKRGFSSPERLFVQDTEEKLKEKVIAITDNAEEQTGTPFAVTMKEAANLQKQNNAAHAACKYPAADTEATK